MFRVELFRNNSMMEPEKKFGESSEKSRRKDGDKTEKIQDHELTDTQKKIVNLLLANKQLSAAKIAEQLDLGSRSIEKNIKKLKEYGILRDMVRLRVATGRLLKSSGMIENEGLN